MQLKNNVKIFSILFTTLVVLISLIPTSMAVPQELSVGDSAPNFDIVNIESNVSSQLSDYLGKVIILDLFATWCGPCIAAIPYIIRIQNSYNASDLEIISIDVDETESYDKVVSFAERNSMSWIVSLDESNMNLNYGTGYIPTMYIINQSGSVVYAEIGFDYLGVITALDDLIDADSTAPSIQNPNITPVTPNLSFENNLVDIKVTNITDDFGVDEVFVNVTNSASTNIYPVTQLETGGLNITLPINPVQLFNTESVEVSIGASDYRGNTDLSPPVTVAVELVSEDIAPPQISNVIIQSSAIPNKPSKQLITIEVTVTDDTFISKVEILLKEEGKAMGFIISNITRSDGNFDIFIGYITLSETEITDPKRLYVVVTATDIVGKITTFSSQSTSELSSETTSDASYGFLTPFTILSLIGYFFIIKKRKLFRR